jgi:copper chaperone CopZ
MKNYQVLGMTCSSCEAKVKQALSTFEGVEVISVSKDENKVVLQSDKPFNLNDLQSVLGGANSKYQITEFSLPKPESNVSPEASWFQTYKPILLIFIYIFGITFLVQWSNETINYMEWMRHFMAGFFLVFSFFKLLNLNGFAESYQMYDIIAKRLPQWAYLYAFVELFLGIAYLVNFNPLVTNIIAFIVMSISIIGVLQTVLNKQKIQCACLGSVFNLPMSTVTIIEDGLMILMSGVMISQLIF